MYTYHMYRFKQENTSPPTDDILRGRRLSYCQRNLLSMPETMTLRVLVNEAPTAVQTRSKQSAASLPLVCNMFVRYASISRSFYIPWCWCLTFTSEKWHSGYLRHGERLRQFWLFCISLFSSYELRRDRRTDRRTGNNTMRPVGRRHNKSTLEG